MNRRTRAYESSLTSQRVLDLGDFVEMLRVRQPESTHTEGMSAFLEMSVESLPAHVQEI